MDRREIARSGLADGPTLRIVRRAEQNWSTWDLTPELVPDDFPYGLHRLTAELGTDADVLSVSRLGPLASFRALLRPVRRRLSPVTHVTIAWDEQTGRRLGARQPDEIRVVGVIWATDREPGITEFAVERLTRRMLWHADIVFTLVPDQSEVIRGWFRGRGPRVAWLRFGIDETFFTATPYPKRPLIISAGGDRHRDHETLSEVLAAVLAQRPDCEVVVQANSPVSMPAGVRVVPHMSSRDLATLFQRATAAVVTTKPNLHGSGMTVALEAQASARPVVVTRTPGMQHYVDDGVTGHLVDPRDASAAATALLDLLAHPVEAEQMGIRGRQKVEARHTSTQMAADLAELIRSSPRYPVVGAE